jgi:hypothetical protein
MSEPSRRELLNIVYKLDLYSFAQCAFGVLEPGNRFMPAAYLELLCAALMQVDARAVKRLIINTPPRHLVRRPGRCVDLVSRVHVFQASDSTLHLVGKQLGRADCPRDGRSALAQRRAPHAAAGA